MSIYNCEGKLFFFDMNDIQLLILLPGETEYTQINKPNIIFNVPWKELNRENFTWSNDHVYFPYKDVFIYRIGVIEEKQEERTKRLENEFSSKDSSQPPSYETTTSTQNISLSSVVKDGEIILYTYKKVSFIGMYRAKEKSIFCDGVLYETPSSFSLACARKINPEVKSSNGWRDCKIQKGEKWVQLNKLRKIID